MKSNIKFKYVLLKYLQVLNKNQILLIKMATVHNSMIDPFGFPLWTVQKKKNYKIGVCFLKKKQETAKKRSLVKLEKLRNANYLKLENF